MQVIKPLQLGLLHRTFRWQNEDMLCLTVAIPFSLSSGEIVLEQVMWETLSEHLKFHGFDSGMPKGKPEVIMVGDCCLSQAEKRAFVSLQVKSNRSDNAKELINKTVEVSGVRQWSGDRVGTPEKFTRQPVRYQHAFGDETHLLNPVGVGQGDTVPNLAYPESPIRQKGQKVPAAAFCPLDYGAEQRRDYAGTYDQHYLDTQLPNFANDLDFRYFNDTTRDQWLSQPWSGNEFITITNMHPEQTTQTCELPAIYARGFVQQNVADVTSNDDACDVQFKEIPLAMDTLWLCPNDDVGVMLFRGTIKAFQRDGLDIQTLMIACEGRHDPPRNLDYYRQEMLLRSCPDNGFKYAMYTLPLLADGMSCGFQSFLKDSDFPLEMLTSQNVHAASDGRSSEADAMLDEALAKARQQIADAGLNPDDYLALPDENPWMDKAETAVNTLMEKLLPVRLPNSDDIDFSQVNMSAMDDIQPMMDEISTDAKLATVAQLKAQIIRVEEQPDFEQKSELLRKLHQAIDDLDKPPMWPRIDDTEIKSLREALDNLQAERTKLVEFGVDEKDIPNANVDIDALESRVTDGIERLMATYRMSAHAIEDGRSPHPGQEETLLKALLDRLARHQSLSYGDYACVEFSDIDFSSQDLSCCFFEGAIFVQCDFTQSNLTSSVMVSATFTECIFDGSQLTQTNLGRSHFSGCYFRNVNFETSEIMFSKFTTCRFSNCKFPPLNLIDQTLESTEFESCELNQSNFVNTVIRDSSFKQCQMVQSNMVDPRWEQVVFEHTDLSQSNLVKLVANDVKFTHSRMDNVRFVGGVALPGATFTECFLKGASFREAILSDVRFTKSELSGSDVSFACLSGVTFMDCNVSKSMMMGCNIENSLFEGSNLMEVSLYSATVKNISFRDCNLYSANFLGATLSTDNDYFGTNLDRTLLQDWRP